jgi:nicotinamide mononucleotide (NMN) deamidase PncC
LSFFLFLIFALCLLIFDFLPIMERESLIAQIHASPVMAVLVITGGGIQALADLLAVPGASRTVLEALVPYSENSLAAFLGMVPTRAVSNATAIALAQAAYLRALQLRKEGTIPVIGLACTATLVTDRPKKGSHRVHIGVWNSEAVYTHALVLQKGARDRQGEERIASDLLLQALAQVCRVEGTIQPSLLPEEKPAFVKHALDFASGIDS